MLDSHVAMNSGRSMRASRTRRPHFPWMCLIAIAAVLSCATPARAEWGSGGVPICTAAGYRYFVTSATDGAGGAIMAWQDHRTGADQYGNSRSDIYAGRVSADGVSEWSASGVAVCTDTLNQVFPVIVADGSGGAIIAWQDHRPGGIYAQRVNSAGVPQWAAGGVALCTASGARYISAIASDGSGGAIVGWLDGRNGDYQEDVYVQRVDAAGVPRWGAGGLAVCTVSGRQDYPGVVSDGAGGVIVAWGDEYRGGTWAQRLSGGGLEQWATNGVRLSSGLGSSIVPDGVGGAIVVCGGVVQRVNAAGAPQWGTNGTALPAAAVTGWALAPDGAGGAIIMWADHITDYDHNVHVQRVDAAGAPLWGASGVMITSSEDYLSSPAIVADGAGGAIMTYYDELGVVPAARVSSTGTMDWGPLSVGSGYGDGTMVSDGSGGAIIPFRAFTAGGMGVYASRVYKDGRTPTLASLVSAEADSRHVSLVWYTSASSGHATVYRRVEEGGWTRLAAVSADGNGYIDYEDTDITPGHRYSYRLGIENGAAEAFVGETSVFVPATPRFSLDGARPNPVVGNLVASFSLADGEPATIDVFDVRGRRVLSEALASPSPGSHLLRLEGGRPLPNGTYLLRLKQGRRSVVVKAIVVR